MPASAAGAEGLYFGGFGGLAMVDDIDIGNILTVDNGFLVGGVTGTNVADNIRIEGELFYQTANAGCIGKCSSIEFDVSTLSLLGNAWVDFDAGSGVKPCIGGGLGVARVSIDSRIAEGDDTGLAFRSGSVPGSASQASLMSDTVIAASAST